MRPTFWLPSGKKDPSPLRAGGIIFYRCSPLRFFFLKDNRRKFWEDVGGKTEAEDASIFETVAREGEEETNKLYTRKELGKILPSAPCLYFPDSKYLCFFLPWTKGKAKIEEKEESTGYLRKFCWIRKKKLSTEFKKFHPRLRKTFLLSFLLAFRRKKE
jgi:8-oxo-dGTP pyrophosphatase MutT (NUDIX family)